MWGGGKGRGMDRVKILSTVTIWKERWGGLALGRVRVRLWCEVNGSMTLWGIGMEIFAMPRTDSCGGGDVRERAEGVFVGSGRVKI
jgi:hypothetical protein